MRDTKKLADEICDYIAAPFGIGLNEHVRESVALKIAEALKPSHNKQSTPFTCDGCVVESCDMRGKAIKCNGKVV